MQKDNQEVALGMILFVIYFVGHSLASNCRPCQTRLTIYKADFTRVPFSWFYGASPKWVQSGEASIGLSDKGLEFSALPYVDWSCDPAPFYVDHEKAKLQLDAQPFNDQHLYVEVELVGRTFGTENHPFPNDMVHENDLRLANCGIALSKYIPTIGSFHFMLLLTNDRIYAVWEARQTITVAPGTPSFGGIFAVPVARRSSEQLHHLAIEVLPGRVLLDTRIWVDGRSIGLFSNLIGNSLIIWNIIFIAESESNPIYLSFVHTTFLDGYSPCKDMGGCLGYVPCARTNVTYGLVDTGAAVEQFDPYTFPAMNQPATYWDPVGTNVTNHIWGQGSELFVKKLLVRSVASGCAF